MNHFELFDLPIQFEIDTAALKRQYLKLSRQYHPDFHTDQDEAQQDEILSMSTAVNEAYNVLRSETKRTAYVLALLSDTADEKEELPQSFLMEMMDINEEMMELQFGPDPQRVEKVKSDIQAIQQELDQDTNTLKRQFDQNQKDINLLSTIKTNHLKSKYIQRLIDKVKSLD